MSEAMILAAARTPIGRAHKGLLVDVDAFELGRVAVGEAIARSGVAADEIDDLVLGESLQGGGVIARYVALELGLDGVPGLADNRHCAAGLSAVQIAASSIRAGMDRVVVAGGTESLSSMPRSVKSIPASAQDPQPWMSPSHPPGPVTPAFDMVITVGENTARIAGVTREEADEWAFHSHVRAAHARDEGWFDAEVVPV
jgi:acetyl-CoA acetyltransferase